MEPTGVVFIELCNAGVFPSLARTKMNPVAFHRH